LRACPEQPSICTRRCRRVGATYLQTRAGRPLGAVAPASAQAPKPKLLRPSWSCSRWGLPSRTGRPARWWSLTPPFHPYPHSSRAEAAGGLSLWHCPAGHPGWALPTTLPCGVRTFLDRRASYDACPPRPPGRLARSDHLTGLRPRPARGIRRRGGRGDVTCERFGATSASDPCAAHSWLTWARRSVWLQRKCGLLRMIGDEAIVLWLNTGGQRRRVHVYYNTGASTTASTTVRRCAASPRTRACPVHATAQPAVGFGSAVQDVQRILISPAGAQDPSVESRSHLGLGSLRSNNSSREIRW